MFKKGNKATPKEKPPKVKRDYRKGLKYAVIILVIFWTLGAMRSFTAISRIAAITDEPKQEVKKEAANFAAGPAAENFTEKFLRHYFTWSGKDIQEREERLEPYLLEGIDKQAGLRFGPETPAANVYTTELWDIEETGKNTSNLTYKVQYKTKHIEKEVKKEKKKDKVIEKQVEKGPFTKWVQVSIITDGQNFKVKSTPVFVAAPDAAIIPIEKEMETDPKSADAKTEDAIHAFLQTFFKQYTNGTREELQFLTTDTTLKPIGENLSFEKIEELNVREKSKNGTYEVKATPIFKDSNTNAQMAQDFMLTVFEKDGKWQVKTIN